jgi:hypothetical protein
VQKPDGIVVGLKHGVAHLRVLSNANGGVETDGGARDRMGG